MINADIIARARSTPIEAVIDARGVKLRGRIERVGPCPVCGGRDRFSINVKKQLFNCRGCGKGGDVIGLVQFLDRISFPDAVATLADERFGAGSREPERTRKRKQRVARHEADLEEQKRLSDAVRIWDEAQPIAGTPGETYLAGRGIALDDVPEHGRLRWHPACPWEAATAPCVVARFSDVMTCEPRGVHRRPISGAKPKSLGPTHGCVIRLWPDEEVAGGLVLGEGVETALAAATRIVHKGTLLRPAWAAGSAGNMAGLPVLSGVESLTILVDNDASGAGQRAAESCAKRWREAGREVIRLTPTAAGADFNDLVPR
jgi:phage/plasmid primase-like uncharacterized protein